MHHKYFRGYILEIENTKNNCSPLIILSCLFMLFERIPQIGYTSYSGGALI